MCFVFISFASCLLVVCCDSFSSFVIRVNGRLAFKQASIVMCSVILYVAQMLPSIALSDQWALI